MSSLAGMQFTIRSLLGVVTLAAVVFAATLWLGPDRFLFVFGPYLGFVGGVVVAISLRGNVASGIVLTRTALGGAIGATVGSVPGLALMTSFAGVGHWIDYLIVNLIAMSVLGWIAGALIGCSAWGCVAATRRLRRSTLPPSPHELAFWAAAWISVVPLLLVLYFRANGS